MFSTGTLQKKDLSIFAVSFRVKEHDREEFKRSWKKQNFTH